MTNKEFIYLRIVKGRLNYRRGDLLLYFQEPTVDILYDSIEIYEDAYQDAYHDGCYTEDEINEMLISLDLWHPSLDHENELLKKDIEEMKFQAYKNYFKKKELRQIKSMIHGAELKLGKNLAKKAQLDHLSCDGVANYARWNWVIQNILYYKNGTPYDWKEINVATATAYYEQNSLTTSQIREVARNDPWRSVWAISKKSGNIFNRPNIEMTKDQSLLCGFSMLYDNVYESSESPPEEVIEDDDCLDGWFIDQRRKIDNEKKQQKVDNLLNKVKNKNAGEVFLIAGNNEDANSINSLNTLKGNQIRQERMNLLNTKGNINSDLEFYDVQEHLNISHNQEFSQKMKRV